MIGIEDMEEVLGRAHQGHQFPWMCKPCVTFRAEMLGLKSSTVRSIWESYHRSTQRRGTLCYQIYMIVHGIKRVVESYRS